MAAHLGVGVVGVPGGPERFLPPYIPHQEVSVLHHYLFHVTSNGGGRVDHLIHQTRQEKKCEMSSAHTGSTQQALNKKITYN